MTDSKAPTHIAYALRRLSKTRSIWLEIGKGRLDTNGVFHGFLDRTVIGGFSGYVYFAPIGTEPPLPEPARPAQSGNDAEPEDEI
jgi:hypothetical protein